MIVSLHDLVDELEQVLQVCLVCPLSNRLGHLLDVLQEHAEVWEGGLLVETVG